MAVRQWWRCLVQITMASIRYNMLCKNVPRAKAFGMPERLPPPPNILNMYISLPAGVLPGYGVDWMKLSRLNGNGG